jgi:hypothetical protein
MFNKENGKLFVVVLAAGMVALAVHQVVVAPRLAKMHK